MRPSAHQLRRGPLSTPQMTAYDGNGRCPAYSHRREPKPREEAGGIARSRVNADHELFIEGAWQRTKSIARSSPPPISSATILSGDPVTTSPGTPFYPTALATQYGVNGQTLSAGDALALDGETRLTLERGQAAEVIVFDLAR